MRSISPFYLLSNLYMIAFVRSDVIELNSMCIFKDHDLDKILAKKILIFRSTAILRYKLSNLVGI